MHVRMYYSDSCHEYCAEHQTEKKRKFQQKKKYTFISRKKSRVASWFLNSNFMHYTNGKSENFIYIWKIQTQKLIIFSDYKFKKNRTEVAYRFSPSFF